MGGIFWPSSGLALLTRDCQFSKMDITMATLTKRQEKILETLTQEYIRSAKPVSSKFLEKKCKLGICPATIRIELQKLTDGGYIEQPHTSAGRVPTDRGYRFFSDKLLVGKEESSFTFIFREVEIVKKQVNDELKLAQNLTKSLQDISSDLDFGDLSEREDLFEVLSKIGPSKTIYDKNVSLINSLIEELKEHYER